MWSEIDLQVDKRTYGYGYMDLNEFNTFHKVHLSHLSISL